MAYETLVEPSELERHLGEPGWVIIDCRFDLARADAGRQAYAQAHISGAHYAHLNEDLSSAPTAASGRHPIPDAEKLAARLGQWGISKSSQVLAYDDANGAYAARLWWLLRWLGHRNVAVLNGGLQAWLAAGHPTDARPAAAKHAEFEPQPQNQAWLTTEQVQRKLATDQIELIDARAADRFAGRNETIDPVAGHIPGARNHPFASNLDTQHRFLPAPELRQRWLEELRSANAGNVVSMCGSGVTACHNLLALEIAGLHGARLYAGSWSEWIRDPARPIVSARSS
jgi:thiosulfate/3-mercaptopyruvate sulfurtransferase